MLYSVQRLPRPTYRNILEQGSVWIDRYIEMVDSLLAKAEAVSPSYDRNLHRARHTEDGKTLRKTA